MTRSNVGLAAAAMFALSGAAVTTTVHAAKAEDVHCYGVNSQDLTPLPFTEETLDVVCANLAKAPEILDRPLVIESASTYVMGLAGGLLARWLADTVVIGATEPGAHEP